MILQHGGDYQHYCKTFPLSLYAHVAFDLIIFFFVVVKKLSVTHIIATNLTNAKLQEFRYDISFNKYIGG